jgi:hypothetical protein
MGPKTVAAAQGEVTVHRRGRGWDIRRVDWRSGGADFSSLPVDPEVLLPDR